MNLFRRLIPPACALLLAASATSSKADTIAWTNWSSVSPGSPGTGSGTMGAVTVKYAGQTSGLLVNYPSWGPSSSFTGGTVGNAPPASSNSIQIEGGTPLVETITFSSTLINPVLAIWSLGQGGIPASFDFTAAEQFTIEAGGPSNEYGGATITKSGNNANGAEGNGVIQFNGSFSSISFTTPVYENYYAFTVGNDTSAGTAVTPEPSTLSLFALGLAALPLARTRLFRNAYRTPGLASRRL